MDNENDFTAELEKEKLKLEIYELKKPWYKKPNYLSIVIPSLIALLTIIWTFSSGILDKKYENLRLEKKLLELDIRDFNHKRDSIQKIYKLAVDSLHNLKKDLISRELELSLNYKKKERLNVDKLKTKDEIINFYKSRLDSLTKLIIKNKTIKSALSDENGNYIMTEDGKFILVE